MRTTLFFTVQLFNVYTCLVVLTEAIKKVRKCSGLLGYYLFNLGLLRR